MKRKRWRMSSGERRSALRSGSQSQSASNVLYRSSTVETGLTHGHWFNKHAARSCSCFGWFTTWHPKMPRREGTAGLSAYEHECNGRTSLPPLDGWFVAVLRGIRRFLYFSTVRQLKRGGWEAFRRPWTHRDLDGYAQFIPKTHPKSVSGSNNR